MNAFIAKTLTWAAAAVALAVLLIVLFTGLAPGAAGAAGEGETEWICPPCGAGCDHDTIYQEGGTCPVCGMELVARTENSQKVRKVAILVFDGVQIIDFTGPYEVFGQGPFDVFTVSETGETVTTAMNMSVNPRYSFATAPKPDILIVPGGTVNEQYANKKVLEWVRQSTAGAEHVLSVCNGAFILAKSGVLNGLTATTFYGLIDDLRDFSPKVEVVNDRRFVDNGKIITSAGLSSGIDASLYLVGKILGPGRAQALALHLEYDWNPDSDFARAAFADRRLPSLRPIDGADIEVVETDGDRDRWEVCYRVRTEMKKEDLLVYLRDEVGRDEAWKPDGGADATAWISTDGAGRVWKAGARVKRDPERTDSYLVSLTIHNGKSTASLQ